MSEIDAKFKRSIQGIKKVEAGFDAVNKDISNPTYMTELGNFAADMIRTRTRLGDGVKTDNGAKAKLKSLSPDYVVERAKGKVPLSEFTTAKKSNLTRTGQYVDSIKAKDATSRSVKVGPSGQRDDGKLNEKIGEYVSEQGREHNHPSQIENKRLSDKIRLDLKAFIRKRLKK